MLREKTNNRLMLFEVSGAMKQIFDLLSGYNGRLWLKALRAFFHQEAIQAFGWKVIGPLKLRMFESYEVLMAALEHKKRELGKNFMASEMPGLLQQVPFPVPEETVSFVMLSPEELGFEGGAHLDEIEKCLPSLGLEVCKNSDPVQFLLNTQSSLVHKDVANFPGILRFLKDEIPYPHGYMTHPVVFATEVFRRKFQEIENVPFLCEMYYHPDGIVLHSIYPDITHKEGEYKCPENFWFAKHEKLMFRVKQK